MTSQRKRPVIDDDDDDHEREFVSADDLNQSTKETRNKAKDTISSGSLADYLMGRKAKAKLAAKQKRITLANEDDNRKSPSKSSSASKGIKTEQSIPKKSKKPQTIPKKANENNDISGKRNDEDETNKETTSLLSGMKKPKTPKATHIKKDKPRQFTSSNAPINTSGSKSPYKSSPVPRTSTPPRSDSVNFTQSPVRVELTSSRADTNFGSGLRQLVFDGLKDLCNDTFSTPPERNGVDLLASFLRHKDLKTTLKSGSNDADGNNNLQYDFFDVDDTTGSIVLQKKIPIFPEEFPQGTREWPLSWWGIVDPSIEEQNVETKDKIKGNIDKISDTKPPRERPDAQSDRNSSERIDRSTDRSGRSDKRSTRKRSSRDRHDDEHAYYYDYHSREGHQDRFPARERSAAGYPPPFRGNDFDYDNGYDYDNRNPHRRDGFPHRTGDGPPHDSRSYRRDGPAPGDSRGGPRPYSGQGGGPSRDYPNRDQYGPPGRGPLMPSHHDDRRENRDLDRSRRSPISKTGRDDRWSFGRNPTSNVNRKR